MAAGRKNFILVLRSKTSRKLTFANLYLLRPGGALGLWGAGWCVCGGGRVVERRGVA